jgi:purine-cytosine permease-like protein
MAADAETQGLVEANSISFVPLSARHGSPRDLATLWFTTNIAPLPMVTGAMAVQVYGLSLGWAAIAILTGGFAGACVLALCSAQGPQLGLAQMIQSRGQFGRFGSLSVVMISTLLYLGFFTSNVVLGARSLHAITPRIGLGEGSLICGLAAAGIGLVGYNFIHWVNRVGMVVMGGALLLAFVLIWRQIPPGALAGGSVTPVGFLSMFSLAAVWHISYACYTSDYSRYLPPSVGIRTPFVMSLLGAWLGAASAFLFGAIAVLGAPTSADPMSIIGNRTGWLGPILLSLFVLSVISHNALNMYGAVLSIITAVQTFILRWIPARRIRLALCLMVLTGCVTLAVTSAETFVPRFIAFVILLLVVLAPWATINILDFYLVRHGRYDLDSLFAEDGGRYGLFRMPAILAYLAGIAVQVPFLSSSFYTGPVARLLDGADIGWIAAIAVSALVYLPLARAETQRVATA